MLTFKEQVSLGISILEKTRPVKNIEALDLSKDGINATYVYEKARGGIQVIVGSNGQYVVGNSAKSLQQLIVDFKNLNNPF